MITIIITNVIMIIRIIELLLLDYYYNYNDYYENYSFYHSYQCAKFASNFTFSTFDHQKPIIRNLSIAHDQKGHGSTFELHHALLSCKTTNKI